MRDKAKRSSTAPARAAQTRLFEGFFGAAAQPVFESERGLAYDASSEELLVIDGAAQTLSRFNADGTLSEFPAQGSNAIAAGEGGAFDFDIGRESQVAVDESGTATEGNIYLAQGSGRTALEIFSSEMQGARKGLFVNSRDICRGKNRAVVRHAAHNGRRAKLRPVLRAQGCKERRGGSRRGAVSR